ncbi:MAG TPA: DNA primase [Gemmatimonadaceae bacterium]|nr:DNA primase [Gemmatimonadaceae bacterium]
MIPDEVVDRVRDEADIVEVIGEFVKLKRVGSSFRGPCPFHHGKHDNFSVLPRGTFMCFVCGEKGNVFTFIQKLHGFDFVESVKWVGNKVGVEVREVTRAQEGPDPREQFWELNSAAAEFFRRQLWEDAEGAVARGYLESRDLTREDAERFSLGFAPRDGNPVREHLRTLGFEDERQLAAGILVRRDGSDDLRVRFRHRLMFPIFDLRDHVVGFGGRVLGQGEPKYLNSAESEVFAKRRLLYGLNWAKQAIRKAERVLLVEGYFDLIRLVLAGVDEVVAPLGTALTEAQGSLLRKYTKNVFLLYDSDVAGQKATFRAGDQLLRNGVSVRVVSLPEGEDPDTFVASEGAEGLEREISHSIDIFDRKIQILQRGGWFADLRRKRQALDKLLPTIRATSDRIMRDLYVTRTSEVAGVSRELLERELGAQPAASEVNEPTEPPPLARPARRSDRRANRRAAGARAERELLRVMLHDRRYVELVAERLGAESFSDETYRMIFSELVALGAEATIGEIAGGFDEDAIEVLEELVAEQGGLDRANEIVQGSVSAIASRDLDARLTDIDREMPLAAPDEKDDLIREKERLLKQMQALGRGRYKSFRTSRS